MPSNMNPYLNFRDNAAEAMSFYQDVFGGTLESSTFAEMNMSDDPSEANKIMHSTLTTDSGFVLMASDTPNAMAGPESVAPDSSNGYAIALSGDNSDELRGYWDKLLDGGQMTLPLEKAPWGDVFGMVTDRFGTSWMISIETEDS
ncbi:MULTISPECIES: VOC family protein [Arthrobacter]|uniref:VOC family protein n=1 Tax=Arthrobacter jinronghuae TaxID=2964609 RepID=A0ABT1NSQ3_9MICC|nr:MULTISPECIES: VOC family protein [Arthrobacter]MCC9175482.1 VOC family protein [Arthrobacter sp. zg-Y179]MCQ1950764.1 VOC family protein [Arthrobacter jinronghuae]MCQ1954083.1 VOC family protein [Arthrobacter sp. zg-Y238]MCQ1956980.1 VOC family protein [Arthrobacter jinronghuae]UWX79235.1 VOC family protein [Arthrobacter jinronghuae]